jgi:poly-gamma-glutamate synthesis protein (capsule biosynthesis protein)
MHPEAPPDVRNQWTDEEDSGRFEPQATLIIKPEREPTMKSPPSLLSKRSLHTYLILVVCLILAALVSLLLLDKFPPWGLSSTPSEEQIAEHYPWLYLRDGEPLTEDEPVVEVIIVGDVMPGRRVSDEARPFAEVAPWLREADLALGNLECVVGQPDPAFPDEQSDESKITLHASPAAINKLRRAGFDVLGVANNHALDLGLEALNETVSRLRKVGIDAVGFGPGPVAAFHPLFREVDDVRLALLAFNAVPYPTDAHNARTGWTLADWDPDRAAQAIAAARKRADAVIVSVHWGYEYQTRVDPAQRDIARVLLEAGADLVAGHHPHVVQGTELIADPESFSDDPSSSQIHAPATVPSENANGESALSSLDREQFVAYSLGNFLFDQQQGKTQEGLALRAFFDHQGLRAVQALPVRAGPRPRLLSSDEATALLDRAHPAPARVAFACDEESCHSVGRAQERENQAESGLFWGGEIDLTGDGLPERVRRIGTQAVIYQDGAEVWRSPDTWRVVDLALGDPNDDGRHELLLAFWRPDDDGVPRSQPFIVGYRGGVYRTVWGGSPVDNPIYEVALGDVDGDGREDLVVLEEQAVAVWRWHGWGFSLMWRSPPGRYQDLILSEEGLITIRFI